MSAEIENPEHLSRHQKYYRANREKVNAITKAYYQQHRERYIEYRKVNRSWLSIQQKRRNWAKLGVDVEEAHLLWDSANKCEICGVLLVNGDKNLDHDHVTKQIRGILCDACNRGLGSFKDNPEILVKAARYLQESLK